MKNENQFKVYALDFENCTRLACKGVTVYLSDIQRQTQHFICYEVIASGRNEVGEIVEMVIDCGGGFIYHDVQINNAFEQMQKVCSALREKLTERGFTVERGRVSDKTVFAKFELEGLEGGAK